MVKITINGMKRKIPGQLTIKGLVRRAHAQGLDVDFHFASDPVWQDRANWMLCANGHLTCPGVAERKPRMQCIRGANSTGSICRSRTHITLRDHPALLSIMLLSKPGEQHLFKVAKQMGLFEKPKRKK